MGRRRPDPLHSLLSSSEFDAFYKNYVDLQNTGVKALGGATVENGASAEDVTAAVSGTQATMTYNDGSTKTFNVDWNADDLAAVDTSKAGTYEVKGTVQQTTEAMYNDARADPDIFYNEDDGYYYLTGSTYEVKSTDSTNNQKDSYRSIGLKRAKTINGLKDAEEHIIIKPENGTPGHEDQYPNSFYGWSAFIWAQEFHKINGKWWIVAGFHRGASSTNGGWCNNTILIPYTGDERSIKDGGFLEAENWGEPTVLEGAAFDVTYFEREENGARPRATGSSRRAQDCTLPRQRWAMASLRWWMAALSTSIRSASSSSTASMRLPPETTLKVLIRQS